jgi:hypothetical protein
MTKLDIIQGNFRCEDCCKNFRDTSDLNRHLNTKKHETKIKIIYHCEYCKITTLVKANFEKHMKTNKHKKKLHVNLLLQIKNYKR